jgi:AraC-like DNA-binding protein
MLLQELGMSSVEVFSKAGIDPALFNDPENSLSFDDAGHLLELCVKYTGMPNFGLLVGEASSLDGLGDFGDLARYAPTVGEALQGMILHICTNDRGGVATLSSGHGIAELGYAIYVPVRSGSRHIYNTSLSIINQLLHAMCGDTFNINEVRFTHSRPADIQPYKKMFNAKVVFDADENVIVFDSHWLDKALPGADALRFEASLAQLTAVESDLHLDLVEQIRAVLRPMIVSQRCSVDRVAGLLSMHPRTLNRRLKDRGTTLRALMGQVRYELAMHLLAESKLTLIKVSTLLGYSDPSVFSRAFYRWSGSSPSAWRKQNAC